MRGKGLVVAEECSAVSERGSDSEVREAEEKGRGGDVDVRWWPE